MLPAPAFRDRSTSKPLAEPGEEAPPLAVLRREHADARSVADLVAVIEQVHDRELQRRGFAAGNQDEVVSRAHV